MRSAEQTLRARLTWTIALASIVAAVLATGTSLVLGDALIRANVIEGVRGAAVILQVEIDEAPHLLTAVEEEALELGIDARVAVQREGRVIAGSPGLVVAHGNGECGLERDELVCVRALEMDPLAEVVVAVPAERLSGHRVALGLAASVVLVVVLLGAIAVGAALARRVLDPLARLRDAVGEVDAAAPAKVELPPPTGLVEIDALRGALASLLDRLDAELGRARRFAASAAHELRTPLTKILAEVELARETAGPNVAPSFARIERTTARLATLTERLLLLATPREALASEVGTSMSQLVEELPTTRSPDDAARIVIAACSGDAWVRGDEVLLAAMLDNVVDNALKYSRGEVRVSVREQNDEVVVEVADDGPGLPGALAREAFVPFRRGDDARAQPGHGLGLALVAHVVRAYDGEVAFVDAVRGGACLQIRLPLRGSSPT
jgi:signal transduction histidine kinase